MSYVFGDLIKRLERWNHRVETWRYWPFSEGPMAFIVVAVFLSVLIVVEGRVFGL